MTRPIAARTSSLPTPLAPDALPEDGSRAVVIEMPRLPDLTAALSPPEPTPFERALRVTGVKAVGAEVSPGETELGGAADAAFVARAGYFVELARTLGSELGLESMNALVLTSASRRVVSVVRGDVITHASGDRDVDATAVIRALDGHQGKGP